MKECSSNGVSVPSPGEVPETGEALLNAFKRLDNDLSLEAQVGVLARLLVASLATGFLLWGPGLVAHRCASLQVGDPNAYLHYWVLRVAFSGATACVAHIDGSDLYVSSSSVQSYFMGTWFKCYDNFDNKANNSRVMMRQAE
jgi:pyruvate dehydrogenase phosphatase